MRVLEILELGGKLRRQAQERCASVNEAHLLVHEVMLCAFGDDPNLVGSDALHGELSSRLAAKLDETRSGACDWHVHRTGRPN